MENKKGSGIFLGVVSVATLIVAIIGATFAFFSASVTGNGNVDLTAYEFNASLTISPVYPTSATKLVPLDPDAYITVDGVLSTEKTNLTYAMNEAATRCIDSAGYQVCAVYKAVFTNNGTEDVTLDGVLTTVKNTPGTRENATGFTNLKFSLLTGTDTANNLALDTTEGSVGLVDVKSTEGQSVDIGEVTVGDGESVTKYFVVYLDEAQEDNNPEMGTVFQGQLVYTAALGGQQLTGTFDVTSPAPEDPDAEG